MKNFFEIMVLVLFFASLCVAQKPFGDSSLQSESEREIRKLTRSWDEAMVKRNVNFLDSILSDDYIISGLAKREYLELIKSSEIKYTSFDREIISLRVYGDTALAFGQTNVNGQSSPMGWFSSTFGFMDVWVKQQGHWRCVATKAEEIVQTYQKQKIVRFGPEVKASLVIVFKPDVTDEQVEGFRRSVLRVATSNETESNYLSGIRQYLRVLPIQKHNAVALTFHEDIAQAQREGIMKRVKSSPLVYKVFENIAPVDVKPDQ